MINGAGTPPPPGMNALPAGIYAALAVVYFLAFGVNLVFAFFDVRGFVAGSFFYTNSGAATVNTLGYGEPVQQQLPNITASLIMALVFLIESVHMGIAAGSLYNTGTSSGFYDVQVGQRRVPFRWMMWALSQSPAFVVLAFLSGVVHPFVIAAVVLAVLNLNYDQLANETANSGMYGALANPRTSTRFGGGAGVPGSIEAWFFAFVNFAFIATVMVVSFATSGKKPGQDTIIVYLLIGVLGAYFLMHLLIGIYLTNNDRTKPDTKAREATFLVFQFLILGGIAVGVFVFREPLGIILP